jgi:hypothetical protein
MKKKKICSLCLEEEIGKNTGNMCEPCLEAIKNEEDIVDDIDIKGDFLWLENKL